MSQPSREVKFPGWVEPWLRLPLTGREASVRRCFLLALNGQRSGQHDEYRSITVTGPGHRPVPQALVYTAYGLAFTDG